MVGAPYKNRSLALNIHSFTSRETFTLPYHINYYPLPSFLTRRVKILGSLDKQYGVRTLNNIPTSESYGKFRTKVLLGEVFHGFLRSLQRRRREISRE